MINRTSKKTLLIKYQVNLHPIMDSTSPTHEGFQWWDDIGSMMGPNIVYHWFTEQWYLDSEISRTVSLMHDTLEKFGININD